MNASELVAVLKEYGLAGVMAWLFWWTLRRMMHSHDSTVSQLKGQLDAQAQATRAASDGFTRVVENHMIHVRDALSRFDTSLIHHADDQQRWQDRLLGVLDRVAERLGAERSGA